MYTCMIIYYNLTPPTIIWIELESISDTVIHSTLQHSLSGFDKDSVFSVISFCIFVDYRKTSQEIQVPRQLQTFAFYLSCPASDWPLGLVARRLRLRLEGQVLVVLLRGRLKQGLDDGLVLRVHPVGLDDLRPPPTIWIFSSCVSTSSSATNSSRMKRTAERLWR